MAGDERKPPRPTERPFKKREGHSEAGNRPDKLVDDVLERQDDEIGATFGRSRATKYRVNQKASL